MDGCKRVAGPTSCVAAARALNGSSPPRHPSRSHVTLPRSPSLRSSVHPVLPSDSSSTRPTDRPSARGLTFRLNIILLLFAPDVDNPASIGRVKRAPHDGTSREDLHAEPWRNRQEQALRTTTEAAPCQSLSMMTPRPPAKRVAPRWRHLVARSAALASLLPSLYDAARNFQADVKPAESV